MVRGEPKRMDQLTGSDRLGWDLTRQKGHRAMIKASRAINSVLFLIVYSGAVLLAAALVSQTEAHGQDSMAGQKIVVAGTGDSQNLLQAVAAALESKHPGIRIEIPDSIGSSGGLKALEAGKCDLARVARPLKDQEQVGGLTYILFARSPVVFVVNPSVAGIDNLTLEDIIRIYKGKVVNWEELGAGAGKIYPITREPGDSSLSVLQENIPDFREMDDSAVKVTYRTPDTVATLTDHINTIGFLPMTAIRGTKLRVMKVGGVFPSAENVNTGRYKLTTPYAIVYKEEPAGLAKAFIDFLFSDEGMKIITEYGAVPVQKPF